MKSEHSNWLSGGGRRLCPLVLPKSRHSNSVKLRNDQWSVAVTLIWAGEIRHLQFLKFPLRFQTNKKGIPIKDIPFSLYIIPIKEIPFSLYIIPMEMFQTPMETFQIPMEMFSPHNIVTKHLNNASS